MADAKYGLRTVTRATYYRQAVIGGLNFLIAIPTIVAPTTITINQNEQVLDLPDVNCKGENVVALTLTQGRTPELQMSFSTGTPDFDSFAHGRLMKATTNFPGFVYFETVPTSPTLAARTIGNAGFEVVAQGPGSTAEVYVVDDTTKLARRIEIVAAAPTNDQIQIDAAMALTFSPELVTEGATIRGWVPCTFSTATITSAEDLGLLTVYAMGVDFDGRFAGLIARNCSRLPGQTNISSNPERSVTLRILPDPNDGTGLGYQMYYTNQKVVC